MKESKVKIKLRWIIILLLVFCFVQVFADPCGDVNSDGAIDIVDALLIAQYYVGLNPSNFDSAAADVNGDGGTDIVDALLVAQYYVGLITSLSGCETVSEVTYELQAEDTATWDSATVDSDNTGYTGSGFVNTENVSGTWIEWSLDATQACTAVCVFTYSNGGTEDRPMDVSVNDSYVTALSFPITTDWTTWTTQTAEMILVEGTNTIRLTATSDNGAPNIDKMDITIQGGDVVIPTPAPTQVPTATPDPGTEELLAFPGAEGYGRNAVGGRGGRVIEVTNLNDSGSGSLRDAIDQTGSRTVVFTISGVIHIESKLLITGTKGNGYLTIAGQTAPGKGICISGWTVGMIGGEHVIMRHIRTRVGTSSGETMDGMGMASATNTIFDHCSISWTIDEAFSSRSALMVTLQRCLISEALNEAGHENYPEGTQHGYAASISGDIGSYHHNLLAHCAGRNWSLAGGLEDGTLIYAGRLDIRNNVVYNWKDRTTDGGAHEVNFVNNYYKPGPASEHFIALTADNDGFEGTQRYYFTGNVMEGYWDESSQDEGITEAGVERDYDYRVYEPFFESYVTTQTAGEAYEDVLNDVGCNVPMLDDHDSRVIEEVRNGTYTYSGSNTGLPGLPDNEADVGGLEDYPEISRSSDWDTDHDGMPDDWETAHGLDPSDSSDGNNTNLSAVGYTNLEMYLNELAGDPVIFQ